METKTTYSELLTDPQWQKKRLEIMQRDKFTCQKCSHNDITLNVHHIEYIKGLNPWEYPEDKLITLCKYCHVEIEYLKKKGDKTPFKDIVIFNIIDPKDGSDIRVSVVLHGHICSLKQYRGENRVVHFPFGNKTITRVLYKMFKRAYEWNEPKDNTPKGF